MNPFLALTLLSFMFFWKQESPTFYSTDVQNGLEKEIVNSIYKAKKSVEISVYNLSSHNILDALRRQAAAGIDVTVIVDKQASSGVQKKLGSQVKLALINKKGLMHHKLILIDDKDVWIGSANLSRESLRSHSNIMQKFTSEPLAEYVKQKFASLTSTGLAKPLLHKTFSINNQTLEFWFMPDNQDASLRIKELIRQSKKTIKVAMYTFTRRDFADTLIRAANRGVKVEVIIDSAMCEGACSHIVTQLKNSPVTIRMSEGKSLLHTKMMIVDDSILEQGSANWTKAAFTQNEDYFIILYDLTSSQKTELEEIWKALINRSKSL